jgi:hypothetical protein
MRPPSVSVAGLTVLSTIVVSAYATPVARSLTKLIQFPYPTWIENIALTSTGNLLLTTLSVLPATPPQLLHVDPTANPPTSTLLSSFNASSVDGLLGITELSHDVFAFVAGLTTKPGSWAIWKADLRKSPVAVSKIADVPSGQLLNGLTKLNEHTLLMADSMAGTVLALDLKTGNSAVVLEDASMKPATTPSFKSGINGLKFQEPYVYYTNSALASFHRVRVDCNTGKATGPYETLAMGMPDADDFALDRDGKAYIAVGSGNVIEKVTGGAQSVFAGALNSTDIPGPTAAALGKQVLYVVTNGGVKNKINGTYAEGGSVIAVSLR